MKQIEAGGDWAALKREHSDDPPPGGPYTMLTKGRADHARSVFLRGEMATAFGDVGFSLRVGELGMADFDPPRARSDSTSSSASSSRRGPPKPP